MQRFRFVILVAAVVTCGCRQHPVTSSFEVTEKSIAELMEALSDGRVSSRQLVDSYFDRIEAYDKRGPSLNAMISINPRAREEADALDLERRARGPRGPLHGLPIVVKDNYEAAHLPSTAGSIALAGVVPTEDAFQIRRLRDAGVVILGKTNMDELAWGITSISSLGGQTVNPYDTARNPGGSSGGTAAAVAASFAVFGMGTDTCGSIRYPAAHNNLVGLRTTLGLSSRHGIIPASHTQDIAGPIARTVEDLALVLDATVGPDASDPVTALGTSQIAGTFVSRLDRDGLRDVRVGVLEALVGSGPEDEAVARVFRAAVEDVERAGGRSLVVEIRDFSTLVQGASVPRLEFKFDFNAYLAQTPSARLRTLSDILDGGLYHATFDRVLRAANAVPGTDTKEYQDALAKREVIRGRIIQVMDELAVDVLAYPTLRRTAARIGDSQRGGNCTLSSVTGLPAISVPAGFSDEDGMPVGLELLGRPFADADLVRIAYAYEQVTRHRRAPLTTPPLGRSRHPVRVDAVVDASAGARAAASVRAECTFDEASRQLAYSISILGVEAGEILFTHIHRGEQGQSGPVVEVLGAAAVAAVTGRLKLSIAEVADLAGGRLYVDVHTRGKLEGAGRAQLRLRAEKITG